MYSFFSVRSSRLVLTKQIRRRNLNGQRNYLILNSGPHSGECRRDQSHNRMERPDPKKQNLIQFRKSRPADGDGSLAAYFCKTAAQCNGMPNGTHSPDELSKGFIFPLKSCESCLVGYSENLLVMHGEFFTVKIWSLASRSKIVTPDGMARLRHIRRA